jgi:hypothetical protein
MRRTDLMLIVAGVCAAVASPAAAQQANAAAPPTPGSAGEPKLVFEREVFRYPGDNRRDPFLPLTRLDQIGPIFGDMSLRMIIYSPDPKMSVVLLADGNKKSYRLHRGESVGNATVVEIRKTEVVFVIDDFGVRRQETLNLKPKNTEGAN